MSTVVDRAADQWPGIKFTGGSEIHVSLMAQFPGFQKYKRSDAGLILKIMDKADLAGESYAYLQKCFPGFEWLLASDQFRSLFMVDMYRHLHSLGPCVTEDRFKNPVTGNWFHKIALMPRWTGGFRNWCEDCYAGEDSGNGVNIGWRFRIIENDQEDEVDVRERAVKTTIAATEQMVHVVDAITAEVKEPTMEQVKEAVKVYQY